jgi:sugar O-acyltransferase (sialic acid O-acetyltransferase NeuD family)
MQSAPSVIVQGMNMSRGQPLAGRHPLQAVSKGERIVIVGTGESGAVACEYFRYDTPHEVVAFSADAHLITSDTYYDVPVVPLGELAKLYPPEEYRTFVAVSMVRLNRVRRRLYDTVKAAGYNCVSYVSSHAFIMPSVEVGENTFVQENVALQPRVHIGDNVFLGSGTCIGHSGTVEDDCFTGPHVTVCGFTRIGRSSFLGAGSCIADELTVGEDNVISAGAVILKSTKPRQVYIGNPARPVGRDSFETAGVNV